MPRQEEAGEMNLNGEKRARVSALISRHMTFARWASNPIENAHQRVQIHVHVNKV